MVWLRQVTDEYSSLVVAQLLFLQSEDSKKPINMYINSPGTLHLGSYYFSNLLPCWSLFSFLFLSICTCSSGLESYYSKKGNGKLSYLQEDQLQQAWASMTQCSTSGPQWRHGAWDRPAVWEPSCWQLELRTWDTAYPMPGLWYTSLTALLEWVH